MLAAFQQTTEDQIAAIQVPTLVVCGDSDRDNGSPHELVDLLPQGELVIVPGDHRAAAATPELGEAVVGFLTA